MYLHHRFSSTLAVQGRVRGRLKGGRGLEAGGAGGRLRVAHPRRETPPCTCPPASPPSSEPSRRYSRSSGHGAAPSCCCSSPSSPPATAPCPPSCGSWHSA